MPSLSLERASLPNVQEAPKLRHPSLVMQPLVRFAPRLLFDSIACSPASRSLRSPFRPSKGASTCLQCLVPHQTRLYADEAKPPTSPKSTPTQENSPPKPIQEDVAPEELPSTREGRRSPVTKRLSGIMDQLQGNIFIASQRINDLTGYSGIETLKTRISALENHVQECQENVRTARTVYKTTVADRAATQKEVTTLLARKDSWNPLDLERFTSLYRMDHSNEQAVQEAATKLADAEREVEQAASNLSSSILSRYHEEQIWSDKIRRMSTWGTWGLMGVNILLFFVFQFGFEPWRRARLVHGFEEKVLEALEREKVLQAARYGQRAPDSPIDEIVGPDVTESRGNAEQTVDPTAPAVAIAGEINDIKPIETAGLEAAEIPTQGPSLNFKDPNTWSPVLYDLFSQRKISVRKQDVTLAAIEGVATGAAIVTIIATFILRHQ